MTASTKPAAFSVRDFCQWANISRSSFYKEVNAGRIQPVKLGKKTLILCKEAERWLSELPHACGKE